MRNSYLLFASTALPLILFAPYVTAQPSGRPDIVPSMVVAQAPPGAGPGDNDAPGPDGQRKRRDNQQRPGQGGEHRPGGDNQERQRPAEGQRPPREAPGAVLPAAPGNPAAAPTAPRGPQMAPGFHEGRPEGRPPRPTQQPGAASAPPAPPPLPRPPSHRAPHPQSDPPRAIRSRSARPPSSPSRRDPLRFPVCRDQCLRVSPRRQRRLPSVRRRPLRQGQLLPLLRQRQLRRLHLLLRQRQLRRLHPLQLRSRHRQPGPHPLPRLNPVREAGRLSPRNPFPDKRRRKLSPDKSLRAQRGASTAVPCRRPISPNAEFEDLRGQRRERSEEGGRRVIIEEPGNRTIVREGDRMIIRHDELERFRRTYRDADVRVERRDGNNFTTLRRPDGSEIITVLDENGNLVRRVRRVDGREVVLDRQPPRQPPGPWLFRPGRSSSPSACGAYPARRICGGDRGRVAG